MTVDSGAVAEQEGVRLRTYGVPVSAQAEDEREPLPGMAVHRCVATHSFWVERAYQIQPASVEAQDAYFEQFREAIVGCLVAQGLDIDADADRQEVFLANLHAFRDRTIEVDCVSQSGYLQ